MSGRLPANGCRELRGRRTAWVQRSGWKWVWRRSAGDERPWLRGRLQTANGCGELRDGCRRRGCKWLEMGGEKKPLVRATLAARTAADGKWVRRTARTGADGVGARGWLEMGGEKKPLVMSDLGCADGCGRGMGAENCVNGCGRRGCNGVAAEMGGEKKPLVMSDLGCADGCGRQMGAANCADGCGRRGCKGVAGNGWGEAAGDERPWLRGRLRTANGCGELRGRLRTAWVQGGGWKWVGVMSDLGCARGCGRQMGAENCVEGCGRRGCNGVAGNGWGKKPLVMSDLGCADGCGRQMGAENCADGCGRRGCKGVAGNGWGEGKGRERMGKEGTGRERKGQEGKGWEGKENGRSRW